MRFLLDLRSTLLLLLLVLVLSPLAFGNADAQLITNGGFESNSGWTYSGGSARTLGGLLTPANTGRYYGLLAANGGTISQTVNIPAAGTYQLSFVIAPQLSLSLGTTIPFTVEIGGVVYNLAYSVTVLGLGGYKLFSLIVNLPAGITNLIFKNLANGLLPTPLRLDDVSLLRIPGPTPGTSMMSYLAVLLLGLVLARKQMLRGLRRLRGR